MTCRKSLLNNFPFAQSTLTLNIMAISAKSIDLDKIGMTASIICAIHCLALPFLLTAGAVSGLSWLDHEFLEWSFIGIAVTIAGRSFLHSYWYVHHALLPLLIGILGSLLLFMSRITSALYEHTMAAIGGLTLAFEHYVNWQKLPRPEPRNIVPSRKMKSGV